MKPRSRLRWLLLLIAISAGVLIGWWWQHSKSAPATVPIVEGKTIDFSTGQPVVRDEAADRAAIEKAKAEMDEATADIKFAPTKPADAATAPKQPD